MKEIKEKLIALGFKKEGTGGGNYADIRRFPNGLAIYVSDDDLSDVTVDGPAAVALFDNDGEFYAAKVFDDLDGLFAFLNGLDFDAIKAADAGNEFDLVAYLEGLVK